MDTAQRVLKSSTIMLGLKLFQRIIGLISLLVLARTLSKEDFAVVAIVTLVIFFFDTIGNTGIENYLIQKSSINSDDVGTAWTLDLTLKLILSLLIFSTSDIISDYFNMPQLVDVLRFSCIIILFNSLKNPEFYVSKRNLNYRPIFIISSIQKITSFVILISILSYEPTYWAIIIADISASIVQCVMSWILLKNQVKITLSRFYDQWSFSSWVLLRSIVGYSKAQMDAFLVGKYFSASDVGLYSMTRNISVMPSTDIIGPAIEPLLSAFSKDKGNVILLKSRFNKALLVASVFTAPVCAYMFFYSDTIVKLILGEKWIQASLLLPSLSIAMAAIILNNLLNQLFIAQGLVRQLFYFEIFSLLSTGILLYACQYMEIYFFTLSRVILILFLIMVLIYLAKYYFQIDYLCILKIIIPIFICATISGIISRSLTPHFVNSIVIEFLVTGLFFTFIFLFFTTCTFKLFYMNTDEGRYLVKLSLELASKLKRRISSR